MNEKILLLDKVAELNRKNIDKLKDELHKDEWTLCLGAGISKSAGLPDWYTLLSKMMARLMCLGVGKNLVYEENEIGWEYRKAKADLIKQCGKSDVFKEKLKDALDGKIKYAFEGQNTLELAEAVRQFVLGDSVDLHEGDSELANFYVKQLVKESCVPNKEIKDLETETLGSITNLLLELKKGQARHVITYNYDNLLEECLRTFGDGKIKIQSVSENPEQKYDETSDSCIIYHVHGCIPIHEDMLEEESEKIVLTETSYYNVEKLGYSWSNIVQTQRLASSSILFIGFSGQDYNFRRILKNMERNRKHQHYILFCIDDFVNKIFTDIKKVKLDDKDWLIENYSFELLLLNQLLNAQYVYWNSYGLIPIWTTIDEIPQLIESFIK